MGARTIANTIKRMPVVGPLAERASAWAWRWRGRFRGSERYWIGRYREGGNSGAGSYSQLALFKAEVMNGLLKEFSITSAIEFGMGDGNQLSLIRYPVYLGFDVSPEAVAQCRARFVGQHTTHTFRLMRDYADARAELTVSMDVIFHLVEDRVFADYMTKLFDSATRYVVIYSTNEDTPGSAPHVRHRRFTDWIERHRPAWRLLRHVPNQHPFHGDHATGSGADFYLYGRAS